MNKSGAQNDLAQVRAAISTRYSSDMQRPTSAEDQERECREAAEAKGWIINEDFVRHDAEVSGKSLVGRLGLESLIEAAKQRPLPFNYLILDDTSRLGRNLGDILHLEDTLKFHGVGLYFVTQKLDSNVEGFRTMLTMYGMFDEQYIHRLAKSVHRGQKGRVLQGYTSGSRCFGYRSVRKANPDRPDDVGRAGQLGSVLEIIESEAETIRRIYDMFACGISVHQIVRILTEENVPAARKPRIGDVPSSWNSNLVNRILRNTKYRGVNRWNARKQFTDPQTHKIEVRRKPETEVVEVECPTWRIVSEEQWNRVQDRIKIVDSKVTKHRLGGMNRAKTKSYLFSGLLECGICGTRMAITGGKGLEASYGCVNNRNARGCPNKLRVRQDRLAAYMIDALSKQVLSADYIDYLANSVHRELSGLHAETDKAVAKTTYLELLEEKRAIEDRISRLLDLIENSEVVNSAAIASRIAAAEKQLDVVVQKLKVRGNPKAKVPSLDEVRASVQNYADSFSQAFYSDVDGAKRILQQHIEKLVLHPGEGPDGWVYSVIGDLNLMGSDPNSNRVLLEHSSNQLHQYYNHLRFWFAGPEINPYRDLPVAA